MWYADGTGQAFGRFSADGGGSDAYAITMPPSVAEYVVGMSLEFKANTANTDSAHLNINGIGSIELRKDGLPLQTGDILAGAVLSVIYDGTYFQVTGGISSKIGVVTITSNHTALTSEKVILIDATNGNVSLTMPLSANVQGYSWVVVRIDATANVVQILPSSGDNLATYDSVQLILVGTPCVLQADGVTSYILR